MRCLHFFMPSEFAGVAVSHQELAGVSPERSGGLVVQPDGDVDLWLGIGDAEGSAVLNLGASKKLRVSWQILG